MNGSELLTGNSSARLFAIVPVTDLVEAYIDSVTGRDDATTYEQMRPLLFEHYYSFWTPRRAYDRPQAADRCSCLNFAAQVAGRAIRDFVDLLRERR